MARLLVATTLRSDHPDFDDENRATADALADLGLRPQIQPWHTGLGEWTDADLVLVRTPWDYAEHLDDFERWLDTLEGAGVPTINPIPFLRWNLRKTYLHDLENAGVAIVPTEFVEAGTLIGAADHDRVVKPVIGSGGSGTELLGAGRLRRVAVDSLVNPFLSRVMDGECSIFIIDGEVVRVFKKLPDGDDFRVQLEWGGKYHVDDEPETEAITEAHRAYEAADRLTGGGLVYLRVDLLQDDADRWRVLEAEGLGPSLYCTVDAGVDEALADAVSRRLPDP